MRVAVVAGPDPGHAFPAIALCTRLRAAGDDPVLFTGRRWLQPAADAGLDARLLRGLAPRSFDDDADAGRRLHERAAYISTELLPDLAAVAPDLVVSDVLTAGGGLAAERLGVAWVQLSPHPLYAPSIGLPPIGSGLAVGRGVRGHARDRLLRALTKPAIRRGRAQRSAARVGVGLPAVDPGPAAELIATLPALEVSRPDWPDTAHVVGPLHWEPTAARLPRPPGDGPLVMIAPSTAHTGAAGMLDAALRGLARTDVRVVVSMIDPPAELPPGVVAGLGRQDELLPEAAAVICGAGHGLLSKALLAGTPVVAVPGGGDQWELANRAQRQGSALLVRPPEPDRLRAAVLQVIAEPSFAAAAERAARGVATVADPVAVCHAATRVPG
ncbi:glycosyltransferase [Skermania piniformis]|uniref:Glycosyl transferase n=1 Tax=Skermania pinensis TaxID=39122 RepID=A0ABX8S567_9ACTN|nr:nucleotide disphospho-sugar-binding domain-containing protein [Skermania piniformis]QXQ12596.1 glycosyl transferase [Skermania piniformis]